MALKLTISAAKDAFAGQDATRVLNCGRLTIGRSVGNNWTLPDPTRIISKFHCVIEGSGNSFRITDNSSNGIFINGSQRPLGRGNSHDLHHGDQISLGPYCMNVAIIEPIDDEQELTPPDTEEPLENAALLFDNERRDAIFAPQYYPGPISTSTGDSKDGQPFSLDAPLSTGRRTRGLADLDGPLGLDDAFAPPAAKPAKMEAAPIGVQDEASTASPRQSSAIPTNWYVAIPDTAPGRQSAATSGSTPRPSSAPAAAPGVLGIGVPVSPQGPTATDANLLAAFLDGAGIGGLAGRISDPSATMHSIGEIFRTVIEGVIVTLEARKTVKRELGVAATEFRSAKNNPLKFTLGVDDTMETLLTGDERGYLPAPQAFQDAFADITQHQMAVLAGMQEAWTDLLRRFDPEAIKGRVGDDGGVGALLASKKSRYWDAFVQLHAAVTSDADNEYRSLFYRVFGETYERYLRARRAAVR